MVACLKQANIKLKLLECDFIKIKIQYLGHMFLKNSLSPLPETMQFLRLAGYYRNHINHYREIIHTLTRPLRKDELYVCTKTPIRMPYKGPPFLTTQIQMNHISCSQMPPNIVGLLLSANTHPKWLIRWPLTYNFYHWKTFWHTVYLCSTCERSFLLFICIT